MKWENPIKSALQLVQNASKSKDGRVLFQNFSYLSLLQIASYAFPLLTIPYLARIIGAVGFGKLAFASAVIMWLQTLSNWGFNYSATRDVARIRDNKEEVSKIFSNVLWARFFLMFSAFLILVFLILCFPKFRENANVLFFSFLIIPGHILCPDWFFQAFEKMKYITILNVLSKAFFTVAIFVFIKQADDYILQPIFTAFGYLISGCVSLYIISRWQIKIYRPSRAIWMTIKKSSDFFLAEFVPNLYHSFSVILLGFWGGPRSNGLLDAADKFFYLCNSLLNILSRTFYPFLSRKIDKHSFYSKMYLSIAFVMAMGLFFSSPLLIKIFYTEEFSQSILVLQILSVSLFGGALINVYGVNYLAIVGRVSMYRRILSIGSLLGLIFAIPLVYYFGLIGTAIAISSTRCVMGYYAMRKAKFFKYK